MSNELIEVQEEKVLEVFSRENGLDFMVNQAKDLVNSFEHDLSTATGRKRTASLAAKVAKLKTRLDGMGKDLTANWKAKAKAVDVNRKAMRDSLDELKAVARKPLTEWEDEQKRIEEEKAAAEAAEKLRQQVESDHEIAILMNEKIDRDIEDARKAAEEAEAKRVKAEKEAQAAREEQIRKDAEEKAKREAEQKAREEAERLEKEKQDLIRKEHEAKIRAEQEKEQRIAAEEAAKQKAIDDEIKRQEQAKRAELEAKKREEAARQAEIERQNKEAARLEAERVQREANKAHVTGICTDAKLSLMAATSLSEAQAIEVVKAIRSGLVAHTSITF